MKQFLKFGLIVTMATSGLLFTACEGEDGDPGATGPQGEKGDKGDTGDTGENGVGFDETTQYGNIVVRFKGTRSDNAPFDKTIDFKFAPVGPDAANASGVGEYFGEGEGDNGLEFNLARYNSPIIAEGNANFRLNYYDVDGEDYLRMYTNTAIVSDDMKFFTLDLWGHYYQASEAVTEYSFNTATGEQKYKFHAIIPANDEDNNTGHEIDITADVNVKVLQRVQSPS